MLVKRMEDPQVYIKRANGFMRLSMHQVPIQKFLFTLALEAVLKTTAKSKKEKL